jgi:pantothenate kinase-related protein Tda10
MGNEQPSSSVPKQRKRKNSKLMNSIVNDEEIMESINNTYIPQSFAEGDFDFFMTMNDEQMEDTNSFNIFILGTRESGKSTLVNQIRKNAAISEKFEGTVFYSTPKDGKFFKKFISQQIWIINQQNLLLLKNSFTITFWKLLWIASMF